MASPLLSALLERRYIMNTTKENSANRDGRTRQKGTRVATFAPLDLQHADPTTARSEVNKIANEIFSERQS